MTYRINYRAAQGQQSQGSPGGGYLLDTIRTTWAAMASGAGVSLPVAIVPHFDTTDFGSSILGDYEPQTFTPHVRIGRVTFAFATSVTSVASTSAPLLLLKRFRPNATSTATVSTTIATFDFSANTIPLPWYAMDVNLISNGTLNTGDVLTLVNAAVSFTLPVPAGAINIDFIG